MTILPPTTALLLVDLQKGFDEPTWGRRNNPQMESQILVLLQAWRAREWPVFHVRHMSTDPGSPLWPGKPGNNFKEALAPVDGERLIEKRVHSSFIGTSLEEELRRCGCRALVIVGMTTNHCVSTTTRMAGNLGFETWVVSDATSTFDRAGPDGIVYPAELIHAIALSDLHGEFATVLDMQAALVAVTERGVEPTSTDEVSQGQE
jgi:nicotinamidase-related amidase